MALAALKARSASLTWPSMGAPGEASSSMAPKDSQRSRPGGKPVGEDAARNGQERHQRSKDREHDNARPTSGIVDRLAGLLPTTKHDEVHTPHGERGHPAANQREARQDPPERQPEGFGASHLLDHSGPREHERDGRPRKRDRSESSQPRDIGSRAPTLVERSGVNRTQRQKQGTTCDDCDDDQGNGRCVRADSETGYRRRVAGDHDLAEGGAAVFRVGRPGREHDRQEGEK